MQRWRNCFLGNKLFAWRHECFRFFSLRRASITPNRRWWLWASFESASSTATKSYRGATRTPCRLSSASWTWTYWYLATLTALKPTSTRTSSLSTPGQQLGLTTPSKGWWLLSSGSRSYAGVKKDLAMLSTCQDNMFSHGLYGHKNANISSVLWVWWTMTLFFIRLCVYRSRINGWSKRSFEVTAWQPVTISNPNLFGCEFISMWQFHWIMTIDGSQNVCEYNIAICLILAPPKRPKVNCTTEEKKREFKIVTKLYGYVKIDHPCIHSPRFKLRLKKVQAVV